MRGNMAIGDITKSFNPWQAARRMFIEMLVPDAQDFGTSYYWDASGHLNQDAVAGPLRHIYGYLSYQFTQISWLYTDQNPSSQAAAMMCEIRAFIVNPRPAQTFWEVRLNTVLGVATYYRMTGQLPFPKFDTNRQSCDNGRLN